MEEQRPGTPNGAGEEMTEPVLPAGTGRETGTGNDAVVEPMWDVIKRLPNYARVATALARDERVPKQAKAYLLAGGAYLVSPIDLIPGIIPVAGQVDDLYVVLTGLQQAIRVTPSAIVNDHFAAVGLQPSIVDEDLATIRRSVRRGIAWSMRQGGALITRMSRQAMALARRAGQRGVSTNDQEPL